MRFCASCSCVWRNVWTRFALTKSARVVAFAGNGPVFSSGPRSSEMVGQSDRDHRELFELCSRVMLGFRRLDQPVIARVHGLATAAGCQLVASLRPGRRIGRGRLRHSRK